MKGYRVTMKHWADAVVFVTAPGRTEAKSQALSALRDEGLEDVVWVDLRVRREPRIDGRNTIDYRAVYETGELDVNCCGCGTRLSYHDRPTPVWLGGFTAACDQHCMDHRRNVDSAPPGYPSGIVVYFG